MVAGAEFAKNVSSTLAIARVRPLGDGTGRELGEHIGCVNEKGEQLAVGAGIISFELTLV